MLWRKSSVSSFDPRAYILFREKLNVAHKRETDEATPLLSPHSSKEISGNSLTFETVTIQCRYCLDRLCAEERTDIFN